MPEDRTIEIIGTSVKKVEIAGKPMQLEGDAASTTVTLPDDLGDGPWPVVVTLPNGTALSVDYKYRKSEEGENQIIIAIGEETIVKAIEDGPGAVRDKEPATDHRRPSSRR
jgi:hypothetical protein